MTTPPVDRFDEIRRAWIAAHHGSSTIQRRRAEALGRKIRARQRAVATAVPDPHDDTVIPPLWLRTVKSPASQLELLAVTVVALAIPLGMGRRSPSQRRCHTSHSPTLARVSHRGVVVVGCHAGTADCARLQPRIDIRPDGAQSMVVSAGGRVPTVAGVYGVAEGWLAVSGSCQWWPLTPPQRPLTASDAAAILGGYDTTGPALLDGQRLNEPGERSRS